MNSKSKNIATTIGALKAGQKVEVMSLISNTPQSLELASSISKLVRDIRPAEHTNDGTRQIRMPDSGVLQSISSETSKNISENATIYELLPDYESCISLLVSSVLSPKDLMNTEIIFNAPADIVPPNISSGIINILQNHFDRSYKIKSKLPKILREVLFTRGSHILAVLPENAVDDLINRDSGISIESLSSKTLGRLGFNKSRGLLGPRMKSDNSDFYNQDQAGYGIESLINRARQKTSVSDGDPVRIRLANEIIEIENTVVTDNPNILRLPRMLDKIRSDSLNKTLSEGNESIDSENASSNIGYSDAGRVADKKLTALIYKSTKKKQVSLGTSKSQNQLTRHSVTGPLVMQLPSESVIPVFVPGQQDRHVGYFVLLDMNGNPVSADDKRDNYRELQNQFASTNSQQSHLISRMNNMLSGISCPENLKAQTMVTTYADLIEQDLLARLRNGKYNNDYSLGRSEDVYRVMLSRALSQRRTQILFLPVEQVTYFATRYNKHGIGVSIMDETKLVNSQRAIVSLANTLNNVRNSIGRTIVDIKMDPDDPDPRRRFEEIRSEIIRTRHLGLPIGADSVTDMVNSLQLSQYEFKTSGHEGMPDMSIEFSQSQSSYPQVDTEYEESLRRRSVSATGLTVEAVDNNFNGETATSVVSSNIMLSRKVMIIQDEFSPHLSDHVRKVTIATPDLMDEITELVETNYSKLEIDEEEIKKLFNGNVNIKRIVVKQIVKDFLNGLEITLPRPTTVSLENQLKTVEVYVDLLDKLIEAWVNDEMLGTELSGEISEKTRSIVNSIRSHYIRQFCSENAILPELFKIATLDDTGKPEIDIYDMQRSHIEALIKSFGHFLNGLTPKIKESNALIKKLNDDVGEDGGDSSTDYSSDDSTDYGGTDSVDDEVDLGETDPSPDDTPDDDIGAEPTFND